MKGMTSMRKPSTPLSNQNLLTAYTIAADVREQKKERAHAEHASARRDAG